MKGAVAPSVAPWPVCPSSVAEAARGRRRREAGNPDAILHAISRRLPAGGPTMGEWTSLRATLKRGAFVTAANWPVVVVQFVAESTFKLLLGVPVVGAALLVALALGRDLEELLGGDLRDILASIAEALADQPGALASVAVAGLVVLIGGSTLMFLVKGGTVTVLARGEAQAGPVEQPPLRLAVVRSAAAFAVPEFLAGCQRLFRRYLRLGFSSSGSTPCRVGYASSWSSPATASSGRRALPWPGR